MQRRGTAGGAGCCKFSRYRFDLKLASLSGGTPQATYMLATFTGGITGTGGPISNGVNVTSFFTFSGSEAPIASAVTVVPATGGGQSLQLTLNVPEPGTMSLCAVGCGLLAFRRRRRS